MVATTLEEPTAAVVTADPDTRRPGRLLDPLAVAVLAAVIGAVGAGHPSLWFDESATISSAGRSIPELWRLVGHIDAVHGLFYLLMHGWFCLCPADRVLVTGAELPGRRYRGRRRGGPRQAISAAKHRGLRGIVFALLPRVTWAAVEARSYALQAVAAVWLTVLLITAIRRHRWWLWALYALALMVAILLNIYLVLAGAGARRRHSDAAAASIRHGVVGHHVRGGGRSRDAADAVRARAENPGCLDSLAELAQHCSTSCYTSTSTTAFHSRF